jgi:hypothetical protein
MEKIRRKPARERKEDYVKVRLNIAERNRLEKVCKEHGLSISEVLRWSAIGISDKEVEAIANNNWYVTSDGVKHLKL